MNPLAPSLRRFLEGQLGASILADRDACEQHIRFLVPMLTIGAVGLAAFPLWLVAGSYGGAHAAVVFAGLIAPLAIAATVLRSGRIELGRRALAIVTTALVAWICALTGWGASPAMLLFAGMPTVAARGDRAAFAYGPPLAAIALVLLGGIVEAGLATALPRALATAAIVSAATLAVGSLVRRPTRAVEPERPSTQPVVAPAAEEDAAAEGASPPDRDVGAALDSVALLAGMIARERDGDSDDFGALARLITLNAEQVQLRLGGKDAATPVGVPRRQTIAGSLGEVAAALQPLAGQRGTTLEALGEETRLADDETEAIHVLAMALMSIGIESTASARLCLQGSRLVDGLRMTLRQLPDTARKPFVQHKSRYSHMSLAQADLTELTATASRFGATVSVRETEGLAPAIVVDWAGPQERREEATPGSDEARRSA